MPTRGKIVLDGSVLQSQVRVWEDAHTTVSAASGRVADKIPENAYGKINAPYLAPCVNLFADEARTLLKDTSTLLDKVGVAIADNIKRFTQAEEEAIRAMNGAE